MIDKKGVVIWESGFPETELHGIKRTNHEVYIDIEIKNSMVIAKSLSGFLDYLDIDTGKVTRSIFVK